MNRPSRVLCILGMHRSGTSCLTGSLQQGGLFLGKHHTWNEYNRRGNRENQDVVNLNEAIFKANNLTWKKPTGVSLEKGIDDSSAVLHKPVVWEPQHRVRVQDILAGYADKPLWGFKDPRTLITLEGWLELVPDMEFVGIYRHPMAVAQSLASRPGLPVAIQEGLAMWYVYNSVLLQQYQRRAFPILCFDWSEDVFHGRLDQLHQQLGLQAVPSDNRFYTSDLYTHLVDADVLLPEKVRALYDTLETISARQLAGGI